MLLRTARQLAFASPLLLSLAVPAGAQVPLPPERPRNLVPAGLGQPRDINPAAAAIGRAALPPKVATIDAATAIAKANAFLNSIVVMTADFVQIGPDGRRTQGKLYVQKPGRLRFDYDPPATLQIISDGLSVAIRDKKLGTQDLYFVSQTPLKFLLKDHIDLRKDVRILDVNISDEAVSILVEDHETFGGTSRIRLVFDPKTFVLKQWTVTDPQGYDTLVTLFNLDTRTPPDPALFKIHQENPKN